jgi:hypothetical protein
MFIVENSTVMTNYAICLQVHELYLGSRQLLIIKAKLQGNGRTCGDDVVLNPMVSRGRRLADIHHFREVRETRWYCSTAAAGATAEASDCSPQAHSDDEELPRKWWASYFYKVTVYCQW